MPVFGIKIKTYGMVTPAIIAPIRPIFATRPPIPAQAAAPVRDFSLATGIIAALLPVNIQSIAV
jgi:hypothetical protein